MGNEFVVGSIVGHLKLRMAEWRKGISTARKDAMGVKGHLGDMASGAIAASRKLGVAAAAISASIGLAAKSFIGAASEAEGYKVRLEGLLGSVEEGNRMFREMADYAARVPFEFREVMGAATTLTGIMKGGVDQVAAWMPMIGDLAAATGLDLQTTTGQFIRMFSAGAASADLFRERGVLAMLGFQQGVTHSAEETRKRLIDAWTDPASKFRGMTEKLEDTWTGQLSMMSDKWFQFRTAIMDSGPFAFLKNALAVVNNVLDQNQSAVNSWIKEWGGTAATIVAVTGAVAAFVAGLAALSIALPPVIAGIKMLGSAAAMAHAKILLPAAPYLLAIGSIMAALAVLAAEIYAIRAAWNQNFAGIRDDNLRWVNIIKMQFTLMKKGIYEVINDIGEGWFLLWRDALRQFEGFANAVIGHAIGIKRFVQDIFNWDKKFDLSAEGFKKALSSPFSAYKEALGKDYVGGIGAAAGFAKQKFSEIVDETIQFAEVTKDALGHWWEFAKDANVKEWSRVLSDQVDHDFDALITNLEQKFPKLAQVVQNLIAESGGAAVAEALAPDIDAMMAGATAATASPEVDAKAASALANMADDAESLKQRLDPVRAAYRGIIDDLKTLGEVGSLNTEWMGKLANSWAQELSEMSAGDLDRIYKEIESRNAQFAESLKESVAAIKQEALSVRADELMAEMQPQYATALDDMIAKVQLLRDTGNLATVMDQNILAPYFWEQWGGLADEAFESLLSSFSQISPEAAKIADLMWQMRDAQEDTSKEAAQTTQQFAQMGFQLNQIADTLNNNLLRRIGAIINAADNWMKSLKSVKEAYDDIKAAASEQTRSTVANIAQMASGALGAVGAVMQLADAFGLIGDKAEEVKHGWDRALDEIGNKVDEWADRLTDVIVEFVKTGKFEMRDFVNSVLEDMLRISIRYAFLDPMMQGIRGFFAKGGVFSNGNVIAMAKGRVITGPTMFPMAKGKTGLMGEAGPEAVMPLTRLPDGDLGVRGTGRDGGNQYVQIIDQRSASAPPVETRETVLPNGDRQLQVYIRDVVKQGIAQGEFDIPNGLRLHPAW